MNKVLFEEEGVSRSDRKSLKMWLLLFSLQHRLPTVTVREAAAQHHLPHG